MNQPNKLSRTFAELLEALNRYRGKGQQKVRVEHVHVHSGDQAIVGMVGTRGEAHRNPTVVTVYELAVALGVSHMDLMRPIKKHAEG